MSCIVWWNTEPMQRRVYLFGKHTLSVAQKLTHSFSGNQLGVRFWSLSTSPEPRLVVLRHRKASGENQKLTHDWWEISWGWTSAPHLPKNCYTVKWKSEMTSKFPISKGRGQRDCPPSSPGSRAENKSNTSEPHFAKEKEMIVYFLPSSFGGVGEEQKCFWFSIAKGRGLGYRAEKLTPCPHKNPEHFGSEQQESSPFLYSLNRQPGVGRKEGESDRLLISITPLSKYVAYQQLWDSVLFPGWEDRRFQLPADLSDISPALNSKPTPCSSLDISFGWLQVTCSQERMWTAAWPLVNQLSDHWWTEFELNWQVFEHV